MEYFIKNSHGIVIRDYFTHNFFVSSISARVRCSKYCRTSFPVKRRLASLSCACNRYSKNAVYVTVTCAVITINFSISSRVDIYRSFSRTTLENEKQLPCNCNFLSTVKKSFKMKLQKRIVKSIYYVTFTIKKCTLCAHTPYLTGLSIVTQIYFDVINKQQ